MTVTGVKISHYGDWLHAVSQRIMSTFFICSIYLRSLGIRMVPLSRLKLFGASSLLRGIGLTLRAFSLQSSPKAQLWRRTQECSVLYGLVECHAALSLKSAASLAEKSEVKREGRFLYRKGLGWKGSRKRVEFYGTTRKDVCRSWCTRTHTETSDTSLVDAALPS